MRDVPIRIDGRLVLAYDAVELGGDLTFDRDGSPGGHGPAFLRRALPAR